MGLLPNVGDMFDLKLDRKEELGLTFVGRFEVLKRDEDRDLFLIKLLEVKQEKDTK